MLAKWAVGECSLAVRPLPVFQKMAAVSRACRLLSCAASAIASANAKANATVSALGGGDSG